MQIKTLCSVEFPQNCYAVQTNDGMFLVDPGEFTEKLEDFASKNAENIKYILLTHCHFDHIRGVAGVKKICPNAKIVIHSLDADGLGDPAKSLAAYFGFDQEKTSADILCNDGDIIEMGNSHIEVLHTPGHSKGGVCYKLDDVIFCGDTLFAGSIGRTDFPGGSFEVLNESLKRLKTLKGDFALYPGHGEPTKLSAERLYNPYMRNL